MGRKRFPEGQSRSLLISVPEYSLNVGVCEIFTMNDFESVYVPDCLEFRFESNLAVREEIVKLTR